MDYETIKPYIEKKLVTEQAHPEDSDVRIFNYTQVCQFAGAWDDVTKQCRGLILNVKTGEIIARPFPKFFNYGEYLSKGWTLPKGTPIITEKLDGSLGILYVLNGTPRIATRGSFTSDQAIWATEWLSKNMSGFYISDNLTYLFEIIYPQNRIVVNYDFSGLVFLSAIDKLSGFDVLAVANNPIKSAKIINNINLEELAKLDEPNSEGFVAYYPEENVRLKIKFPEYVRLHKLITGINEIAIWEHLKEEKSLDDLIEKVPDEFYKWVKEVCGRLTLEHSSIKNEAMGYFYEISRNCESRKDFAIKAVKYSRPSILFAMYNNKPVDQIIWRMIRPHGQKQFKTDIDS